ncbi:BMP family ABC transporter substrate-binding protein [Halomarina pelagica]|uniref:BMP family ABC transporter substrate-binding protein n=1 Tax=Halomarina pelagica TaxID=2961599 RepID=UPI0020C3F568|nr:BMP family ABC transporter substrate-binding protein [Halomarina sp. BND7]
MERRDFLKGAGIVTAAGLAGCTGGPTEGGSGDGDGGGNGSGNGSNGTGGGSAEAAAQIAMVYATGGLGDGSFNDQAQQGVIEAKKKLNVAYEEGEPSSESDFSTFQRQYAQSTSPDFDLVCCIGYLQTDALKNTAPEFPDQKFMIVDSVVDAKNVASYVFKEQDGSYLAGQLAGLLTTTDFSAGAGKTNGDAKVGFVGGVEGSLIGRFEAGYEAGVKAANPDVEVLSNYVGSFNDPTGGKETALSQYNQGADIIYHASGNTGTGVFQAAQEQGRFAIGVDRDQSVTKENFADVILASMVKRVDTAVFTSIEAVVNGEFEGGQTTTLGLKDDGVELVYGQQLGGSISGEVKSRIQTAQEKIIDGTITVPTDPSKV